MKESKELAELCAYVGKKTPLWTQGSGSNISVKSKEHLYIKASGMRLDDVREDHGIAKAELESLSEKIKKIQGEDHEAELEYKNILIDCSLPKFDRLSMESGFHALLPEKYIMHFHSLAAILMCHMAKTSKKWKEWEYSQEMFLLEPIMPGLQLSRKVAENAGASFFLLENHGVILASENKNILQKWEKIELSFCSFFLFPKLNKLLLGEEEASKYSEAKIPFRHYFPDISVFQEKLSAILIGEGSYTVKSSDRNLSELWLAAQVLYKNAPDLPELPQKIREEVSHLPTEKFRLSGVKPNA
jgi:ribulose-5-phosphate 4-epimerase/fuculose-1-phosphate aldolase